MSEAELENGTEMPVGQYLRSIREAKGLKLEDAAQVTKIGKNYLLAIEEGHFEKLPNVAYIKGFLRLYAGFLSLSGDEVVARYENALPPVPGPQVETKAAKPPRPGMVNVEKAKLAGPGRFMITALLLGLVVVTALFFTEGEQTPPPPQPAPLPPAPPPVMAPMTAPVQKQLSSARQEIVVQPGITEPAPQAASGTKQAGVVLRLRFNRDSWLSITIDDSISQRYDLKAGDIIEWKGSRSFVLDLGDGGAVDAEFNGRQLKALGESGQPAHVELKAGQPLP